MCLCDSKVACASQEHDKNAIWKISIVNSTLYFGSTQTDEEDGIRYVQHGDIVTLTHVETLRVLHRLVPCKFCKHVAFG